MNWKNQLGKIIGDGSKTHTCFYQEKREEDDEEKNQSTSPSHTFPFALKLSKSSNKAEKADMHYEGSRIKQN